MERRKQHGEKGLGGSGKEKGRQGIGDAKARARQREKAGGRAVTDLIADATKHLCKSWGFLSAILRTSPLTAPPPQCTRRHRCASATEKEARGEERRCETAG